MNPPHFKSENRITCPHCGRFLIHVKGQFYGIGRFDMNCANCQRNYRHGAAEDGHVEIIVIIPPPAKPCQKRQSKVDCGQLTLLFEQE